MKESLESEIERELIFRIPESKTDYVAQRSTHRPPPWKLILLGRAGNLLPARLSIPSARGDQ